MTALRRRKATLVGLEVAVPLLVLAIWWFATAGTTNAFFPPLQTILSRFHELWLFSHFSSDVLPSIGNLVAGFFIGGTIGTLVGIGFALVRPISDALSPVVHFWRAIPPIATIPIFIAILGFGNEVRILVISLAALFPALIATFDGIRSTEPQLVDVSRVFRLTRWEIIKDVYLPSAGPQIFSGLQVSLQYSLIVMIASEMLGSSHGIGAMTLIAQQSFIAPDMWAGILLLGLIGYFANLLFTLVRRRALRWYEGAKASERAN